LSLSKCPPSVAEALEATDIMIALEATDTKKSRTNFPSIRDTFICLIRVYKKNRVCTKKTSSLRPARLRQSGELAKRQKAEFTGVNEHFCRKRNPARCRRGKNWRFLTNTKYCFQTASENGCRFRKRAASL